MGKYSIKELEKLSGIKAHTIRIWEKRHHIVIPQRTHSNIRYYSDDDLKKIINISLLNNHGVKISKIADLSSEQLVERVNELSDKQSSPAIHMDQLIVHMIDLEEDRFDKTLNALTKRYGFEKTITDIVYPFLEKIGVLWQTGNITPAQEHFISNLIRQKIIVAIDSLPLKQASKKSALIFLPEEELHELGLLFYHYITRKSGYRTYYFGQMVPYQDVVSFCENRKPTVLITAITSFPTAHSVQGYFNRLCAAVPDCSILATGLLLRKTAIKMPPNLHFFTNIHELTALLKDLA